MALEQTEPAGKGWNFASIKELARVTKGVTIKDLIALAPQNDPFYFGTPGDLANAEWFAMVWREAGFTNGGHLRRMHYWCVSQPDLLLPNGLPYENTENCWSWLVGAGKAARYLGFVSMKEVIDQRNPDPHLFAHYQREPYADFEVHPPELDSPYIAVNPGVDYGFDTADAQPYHLEVWVEKSTMDDVLLPICQRYKANLVTGVGEMSIRSTYDLARRLAQAQRPARIFYVSDFDPAGKSMPHAVGRKLEWMLRNGEGCEGHEVDAKLVPLVLTHEQVREYDLPRTPIKDSELRGKSFEEVHGEGAVELDALEALHPGALGEIVGGALADYYDEDAARAARQKEWALQQAVSGEVEKITARYEEEIRALDDMAEELEAITIPDLEHYEPERGPADADDAAHDWLFDSVRDYLEQIDAYNRWKNGVGA